MRSTLLAVWLVAILTFAARSDAQPLDFVVLLVDDQPFHTMELGVMPDLDAWAQEGVRFDRAIISYPLCGPVRASFLSGGFEPRETGVTWHGPHQGGIGVFNDALTLGTRFQAAGYATAHIGKYLNGYGALRPYVPPGWTLWVEKEYVGSSGANPSTAIAYPLRDSHWAYHYRDYALDFLDQHADDAFLLILSLNDPHYPATPAPGDEDLFPDYLYRPPSYMEPDLSDKPELIQLLALNQCCAPGGDTVAEADEFQRDQLRSLVGVDRVVASLRAKVTELGIAARTVFVYFGDNGLMAGEHRLWSKDYAYEESLRVPMIVVAPGNVPRDDPNRVVANLDVPATLYDLAGISADTDGVSLAPLLADPDAPLPAERVAEFAYSPFTWAALLYQSWKYVEWGDGSVELYDLSADPCELDSLHGNPSYAGILGILAAKRASHPRALAFREPRFRQLPRAQLGEPYSYTLPVWGGAPPYHFRLESGELPPGISLDPDTGTIAGVPVRPELYTDFPFYVEVRDSSVTRHRGGPQIAVKELSFFTVPEPGGSASDLAGALLVAVLRRRRKAADRRPPRGSGGAPLRATRARAASPRRRCPRSR